MIKSKRIKSLLLTASFTLGISLFISATAYAATYTAVSGDSLFKISQRYHTTVKNLMNANELNNTSLNIGQVLKVPSNTYTVQKGDTLFLIAQKYKLPLNSLRWANNIYTDNLNIGQTINIPVLTAASGITAANLSATSVVNESAKMTATTTVTNPVESIPVMTKAAEPSSTPTINRGIETSRTPANVPSAETTSTPVNNPTVDAAYSASDLDLLSRLITAEAQGESYDTKVAVGAVVMNRVKSGSFPNSISEVIYQNINGYYQFTPVVNGWIDKPANSDSIKAAKSALNGTDPTNNSLFYYDNKTTNPWMLAKPVSIQIGNMIFAY